MTSEVIKLKVLNIKSLTNYIVRESDTKESHRYAKLEELMQKTYNDCTSISPKDELEVGTHVCAYVEFPPKANGPHQRKAPKRWLRAVVRHVLMSTGTFLYNVYLVDYGVENCVQRSAVHELRPHFTETFVRYQANRFRLNGVRVESGLNSEDSIQMVHQLLHSNDYWVFADIQERDVKKGRLSGSMKLSDGSDLTQFLVQKRLAIDVNNHSLKSSVSDFTPETPIRLPKSSPIISSANNSFVKTANHLEPSSGHSSPPSIGYNSIASISSTDISIGGSNSDESIVIGSDDSQDVKFTQNKQKDCQQKNVPEVMNGMGRGKWRERFQKINSIKEKAQTGRLSDESVVNVEKDTQIEYISHYSAPEEEFDWPVVESKQNICLAPAGALPPPHVLERIFTLKSNKSKNN